MKVPVRHFLSPADGAFLRQAVAWAGAPTSGEVWVFPGSRAMRRCRELWMERAGAALLPRMVTLGQLPEALFPPSLPLAGELPAALARAVGAREAGDALLAAFPRRPEAGDWAGWMALGRQIGQLAAAIGEAGLSFGEVAARRVDDAPRWLALAAAEEAAAAQLRAWSLAETFASRRAVVDDVDSRVQAQVRIVLVACFDLSREAERLLNRALAQGVAVTLLTPALPARQGDAWFDAWGRPLADAWNDDALRLELPVEPSFPGGAADEPAAALEALRGFLALDPAASPDDFSVGLADEAAVPLLRAALEAADVPTRHGPGRAQVDSPPVAALRALMAFLRRRHGSDPARHPEVVSQALAEPALRAFARAQLGAQEGHLAHVLADAGRLPMDAATRERVARLDALLVGLAGGSGVRPLDAWAGVLRGLLRQLFPEKLDEHGPRRRAAVGLQELEGALAQVADLPAGLPPVSAPEAIAIVLSTAAERGIPEEGGGAAVELLGTLEWLLDDAPHLILTGLNGENLPQPQKPHPFLSDGVRRQLGLPHDATRLARDLASLEAVAASRHVALLAPKEDAQGNPLTPSRLLLRCDDATLARRLRAFFSEDDRGGCGTGVPRPRAQAAFEFLPIIPPPDAAPITRLPVTAFREYLACPYRFWLKRHLRLRESDLGILREMDAPGFGTYAHKLLAQLGRSAALRDCTDGAEISGFLLDELSRSWRADFGGHPRVGVRLQRHALEARLQAFARVQAREALEWEIIAVEKKCARDLGGFLLEGRLDRVDRHRQTGALRVLDYKTADAAKEPHAQHLRQGAWVDLQLPLYTVFEGLERAQVGYFNLAKDEAGVAPWSSKAPLPAADGVAEARRIMDILKCGGRAAYFPPGEPPAFDDGLRSLAMDGVEDRAARFARALALAQAREGGLS